MPNYKTFLQLDERGKIEMLLRIKGEVSKENFDLVMFALTDASLQVRSMAKVTLRDFEGQEYYFDPSGMTNEEIIARIRGISIEELERPEIRFVEYTGTIKPPLLSKELNLKYERAKMTGVWQGPFPEEMKILNALRDDTIDMITQILKPGETVRKTFICFYTEALQQFAEGRKSLDGNAFVNVVNLAPVRHKVSHSPLLFEFMNSVERPIYLLTIVTDSRLILFLRNHLQSSRAAYKYANFKQIERWESKQMLDTYWVSIDLGTDVFEIPFLRKEDTAELEAIFEEKFSRNVESKEEYVDLDFEKELKKLELLFRSGSIPNSDFVYRKKKLQKMEFEKYSERNLEILLARRYGEKDAGGKIDEQISRKLGFEKTLLFADIVGFSKKSAEKIILDAVTTLAVHDRILLPVAERFGGKLVKKIGDAFMVRFDEAVNAVKAALKMQQELVSFNEKNQEKILIRIAIHTGQVFIKKEDCFGEGVIQAARMESFMRAGKILITESTCRLLRDSIPLEFFAEVEIKSGERIKTFAVKSEFEQDERTLLGRDYFSPFAGKGQDAPLIPSMAPELSTPLGSKKIIRVRDRYERGKGDGEIKTLSPEEFATGILDKALSGTQEPPARDRPVDKVEFDKIERVPGEESEKLSGECLTDSLPDTPGTMEKKPQILQRTPRFKEIDELISRFPKSGSEEDEETKKPGVGEDSPFGEVFKEIGGIPQIETGETPSVIEKKEEDPRDFIKPSEPGWLEKKRSSLLPEKDIEQEVEKESLPPAGREKSAATPHDNPFFGIFSEKKLEKKPEKTEEITRNAVEEKIPSESSSKLDESTSRLLDEFMLPLEKSGDSDTEDYVLDLDFIFDERKEEKEEEKKEEKEKEDKGPRGPQKETVEQIPEEIKKVSAPSRPPNPFFTPELFSRMGFPAGPGGSKVDIGRPVEQEKPSRDTVSPSDGKELENKEHQPPHIEKPVLQSTTAVQKNVDRGEKTDTVSGEQLPEVEAIRTALIGMRQGVLNTLKSYKEAIKLGYRRDQTVEALLARLVTELKRYLSS